MPQSSDARNSVTDKAGSEMRTVAGAAAYEMADQYFHRGTMRKVSVVERSPMIRNLLSEVKPQKVVHLEGDNIREMMPWLWLSIRANAQNLETYMVSAFFLADHANRPDLAHDLLREARPNHPFNYQIALEDARIYLHERNFRKAYDTFEEAWAFWANQSADKRQKSLIEGTAILFYQALLSEVEANTNQAIAKLTKILEIDPGNVDAGKRIENLKKGAPPSGLAIRLLHDRVTAESENRKCRHDDHDEGNDHKEHRSH